jgi:hypothetical protein
MKSLTRQSIDRCLFLYGTLVSIALTFGAIQNLVTVSNLVTFILFLPVSLYFFIRSIQTIIYFNNRLINIDQPNSLRYFGHFSYSTFINQTDYSFLLTIILLTLAITLTLFRLSSQINQ